MVCLALFGREENSVAWQGEYRDAKRKKKARKILRSFDGFSNPLRERMLPSRRDFERMGLSGVESSFSPICLQG